MLFKTSQRHEEFRAKIREFAESELKPITFMLDKNNEFPGEIVEKLGKMGIMGLPYPKEYGGGCLCAGEREFLARGSLAEQELSSRHMYPWVRIRFLHSELRSRRRNISFLW